MSSRSDSQCIDQSSQSNSGSGKSIRFRFQLACGFIGIFCVAVGVYFCAIQNMFYTHYQPFFDSMGYFDQMHAVMMTGQQRGIAESVYHAFDSGATVFLPYLIVSLISTIVEPSRNLGVWIQTAELGLLLVSVLYYFHYVKKIDPLKALLLVAPFAMTTCLFRANGGMSDFRMDLSLYITFSTTCVWYLVAMKTNRKLHYFFVGLAITATCLFRATAPVYLVLGLGPLALIDLIRAEHRKPVMIGLGVAFLTAVAGSLWFYVLRFEELHYYYFVWNTDANAKLSIAESSQHIYFAVKHIGNQFLYWIIAMNVILLLVSRQRGISLVSTAWSLIVDSTKHTDLRLVWLAAAPVAMLVFRGAGLNQFVCMPAIIGVMLWIMNPIAINRNFFNSRPALIAASAAMLICFCMIGYEGWNRHSPGDYNSMLAHKQTVNQLVETAKRNGMQTANFGSTHVYFLNSTSIGSTIRFDTSNVEFNDRWTSVEGVKMVQNGVFSSIVADANWDELAGTNRQEKLDRLISLADARVDFLIIPDQDTVEFLEDKLAFNIINQHQNYLRRHLTKDGRWESIGQSIKNGKNETVQLYRNVRRTDGARRLAEANGRLIR